MNETDTWQCRAQDTGRKLLGLWTHICLWLSRRGGNEALLRDLRDGWQEDSIQPSGGQPRMNTNKDYEPVINWIMRSPWITTLKCVPSSPSPRIFYEISQSRNLTSGWNDSANLVCIQTGNCNSINFSANCDVIMVIETALNDYYPPYVAKCRCMFVSVAPVADVEELVLAGPQPRHQRRAPLGILAPVERVELRRHAVQVVVRIPEIGNISNTCIVNVVMYFHSWSRSGLQVHRVIEGQKKIKAVAFRSLLSG